LLLHGPGKDDDDDDDDDEEQHFWTTTIDPCVRRRAPLVTDGRTDGRTNQPGSESGHQSGLTRVRWESPGRAKFLLWFWLNNWVVISFIAICMYVCMYISILCVYVCMYAHTILVPCTYNALDLVEILNYLQTSNSQF
jgi:hypothetical protein